MISTSFHMITSGEHDKSFNILWPRVRMKLKFFHDLRNTLDL